MLAMLVPKTPLGVGYILSHVPSCVINHPVLTGDQLLLWLIHMPLSGCQLVLLLFKYVRPSPYLIDVLDIVIF